MPLEVVFKLVVTLILAVLPWSLIDGSLLTIKSSHIHMYVNMHTLHYTTIHIIMSTCMHTQTRMHACTDAHSTLKKLTYSVVSFCPYVHWLNGRIQQPM